MKIDYPKCLLALALLPFSTVSAEEVVRIHPLFDSGRVATRDLATTDFAQWSNGVGSTGANNVGWNESRGIWYSFIRFDGTRTENQQVYGLSLADWHSKLSDAGSVTLRGDVNWHERNPDFPIDPGVTVSVWLIPGLSIPDGSLPGFGNTWPWNYPNAVKVTSFAPGDVPPLHASWDDAGFDPTNTREKMAYALQIDLTDAIKDAIAAGQMSPSTPWGIVFFPEEMEAQLTTPNNPQWIDRRQTVLQGRFWEVVLAEGEDPQPVPPAAPSGLTATSIGQHRIDLSWTDNSSDETSFWVDFSTDGGSTFGFLAELTANTTTYTHLGLAASTTVHYRVRAENVAGPSAWSEIAMATTDAQPVPPVAPSGLTAIAIGQHRIDLSWTDNSSDESSFRIDSSTDGGSTFSFLTELSANTTTYTHLGLAASTTVHYRVRAENANGASAWSATAMATTDAETVPMGWAGFPIAENGWVDTGDFLGWIFPVGDFAFVLSLNNWFFLPPETVGATGAWAYAFR